MDARQAGRPAEHEMRGQRQAAGTPWNLHMLDSRAQATRAADDGDRLATDEVSMEVSAEGVSQRQQPVTARRPVESGQEEAQPQTEGQAALPREDPPWPTAQTPQASRTPPPGTETGREPEDRAGPHCQQEMVSVFHGNTSVWTVLLSA